MHTPLLRGTAAGTEAHWLALQRLFDAGYRSVHWGCDCNNEASRRFAQVGSCAQAMTNYLEHLTTGTSGSTNRC